jgi:type II secretory pathway predicted ATPase ExeA
MAKFLDWCRKRKEQLARQPQLKVGVQVEPDERHRLNHSTDGSMKRFTEGE